MCIALLLVASRIILPIIWTEGVRAVFFPKLAPKPLGSIKRVESSMRLTSSGSLASSTSLRAAESLTAGLSKRFA